MSVWDDPELKTTDDYIKLEAVGDVAEGEILVVRKHTFDDGSTAPQLILRAPDGAEKTWTAGQIQAQRQLAELRPEAGDYLRAELFQIEKRSGGRTLKHIKVEVPRRGGFFAGLATPAPALTQAAAAYDQNDVARQAALAAQAQANMAAVQGYATQAPAYAQGVPAAAPVSAAPAANIPPAPTGIDPVLWASMDDTRRQNILAGLGGQTTPQAVPAGDVPPY